MQIFWGFAKDINNNKRSLEKDIISGCLMLQPQRPVLAPSMQKSFPETMPTFHVREDGLSRTWISFPFALLIASYDASVPHK
jgi:hypothetical protein